jgi:Transposase IS66 family/IS66 Orf2 like protein
VIFGSSTRVRVFVYREPVDMRKAYDTLSALVEGPMKKSLLSGDVFAFIGRTRKRAKALVLDLIGKLYGIEKACRAPDGEDLSEARDTKSREVIDQIVAWVYKAVPKCLPESGLHKAIGYMLNIWPGLVLFLDDPNIPLDSNGTERAARGPLLGRKNHYGSRSLRGTEVAATLYSLVESAKLNDVEPRL